MMLMMIMVLMMSMISEDDDADDRLAILLLIGRTWHQVTSVGHSPYRRDPLFRHEGCIQNQVIQVPR
jgi:hypothetical protein